MSAYGRWLPIIMFCLTVRFQYKADIGVDCSERLLSSVSGHSVRGFELSAFGPPNLPVAPIETLNYTVPVQNLTSVTYLHLTHT